MNKNLIIIAEIVWVPILLISVNIVRMFIKEKRIKNYYTKKHIGDDRTKFRCWHCAKPYNLNETDNCPECGLPSLTD